MNIKFFWLPKEVLYYVIVPIIAILLIYFIFTIAYKSKKGTYYYNYVVDYVYSTLAIIFCSILTSLLWGYSAATLQILFANDVVKDYMVLTIILFILPLIPTAFLIYVIKIFISNLKRKDRLDIELEEKEAAKEVVNNDNQVNTIPPVPTPEPVVNSVPQIPIQEPVVNPVPLTNIEPVINNVSNEEVNNLDNTSTSSYDEFAPVKKKKD